MLYECDWEDCKKLFHVEVRTPQQDIWCPICRRKTGRLFIIAIIKHTDSVKSLSIFEKRIEEAKAWLDE